MHRAQERRQRCDWVHSSAVLSTLDTFKQVVLHNLFAQHEHHALTMRSSALVVCDRATVTEPQKRVMLGPSM